MFVGLFFFEAFGYRYAGIPLFFTETEVVGIDEIVDFFLDSLGVQGYVVLREELFFFVVVDLVIANRANFGLTDLLGAQQFAQVFLLG